MEPVKEVSQSQEVSSQQQSNQPSHLLRKKDDITPKIGQRESYRAYDNSPFAPYEKSKLYQEEPPFLNRFEKIIQGFSHFSFYFVEKKSFINHIVG